MITIKTSRLVLRPWREEDFAPFAEMNADPRVMEWFPALRSRQESDEMATRLLNCDKDWGLWAVSVIGGADFIGFIGLEPATFPAHYAPVGLMPYTGSLAYIYRPDDRTNSKNEIQIDLKNILRRKSPDVQLMARDILYIPDSSGKRNLDKFWGVGVNTASGLLIWRH